MNESSTCRNNAKTGEDVASLGRNALRQDIEGVGDGDGDGDGDRDQMRWNGGDGKDFEDEDRDGDGV